MARFSQKSLLLSATALLGSLLCASKPFPRGGGYNYTEKLRGVNLGGWLILEPWITPKLFDATGNSAITDEWTFCALQDRATAESILNNHWSTFYGEDDFKAIAEAGLNHVRLPIGYWTFDVQEGEPYIQGQEIYINKTVAWARKYGLQVVIDLYGAPGSQNGFINSGHLLSFPEWQSNQTNIDRTLAITKTLAQRYANDSHVIIGPLNESPGYRGDDILNVAKQYYLDSYQELRFPFDDSRESDTPMLIFDGFRPASTWTGFLTPPTYKGVIMDTHEYQIFTYQLLSLSDDDHIALACNVSANITAYDIDTMVGEWAPARTDCARYLNGVGFGTAYDGTLNGSTRVGSCDGLSGSATTFSDDYRVFLRKFWEAQAISYESGIGWTQWLWKTEEGAGEEWSYSVGLEYGWIPQDPTDRIYPNICG